MFCKNCGKEIKNNVKFCPYCGKDTGVGSLEDEPSMDEDIETKNKKSNKQGKKKNQSNKEKKKHQIFLRIILVLIVIVSLIIGGLFIMSYFEIVHIPVVESILEEIELKKSSKDVVPNEYHIEKIDAEEYIGDRAEILNKISVKNSKDVYTEKECIKEFKRRGFENYEIMTDYYINGEYAAIDNISKISSTKHPMYTMNYITTKGEVWTLMIVNNAIMANPLSYNCAVKDGKQIVFSEKETITSYDSERNMFYETIPKKNFLEVKIVDKIDVETIESLTIEVINNL